MANVQPDDSTSALAQFLHHHPPQATWLVACSGGQDSVVLAELCARQPGMRFALAHVNYHLRGAEADGDASFVAALAARLGVPCHTKSAPIERKAGVQATARRLRYAFFDAVCRQHGYYGTLVAQHLQDQAETVLLRLLRGTGLKGLRAMSGWDAERRIGRPLLAVPKAEITAYAQQHQLAWREDASNQADAYLRNRLRHHLLPVLDRLQPLWQQNLLATARQASQAWEALAPAQTSAEAWAAQLTLDAAANSFAQAEALVAAYPGLHFEHALRLVEPGTPKLETAAGVFERRGDAVYFAPAAGGKPLGSRKAPPPLPEAISLLPGSMAPATVAELRAQARQGTFYLAAEACPPPYILRAPQPGDRMQPLGLAGTKLLTDMRQEAGLPPAALRDVRVLVRADGVVLWCSLGVVAEGARVAPGAPALCIRVGQ